MTGGTLAVSRATRLFPYIKQRLEGLGFLNVRVTGEEKDSLNMVINECKPHLVLMESVFYQAATPFMTGEILRRFPKLNIAVICVQEFPLGRAAWFMWYGATSFVNLYEGYDEFYKGLREVREGRAYVSPDLRKVLDRFPEWPETNNKASKRLLEVLVLLCNGFPAESIGAELHVSRKTVYNDMDRLYDTFNVRNRDEMVARAWELHLVTEKDMRFLDRRQEQRTENREQRTENREQRTEI